MRSLPMLCVLSAATLLVRATPAAAQECFVAGQRPPACVRPTPGEQPAAVAGPSTVFLFVRGTDNAVWVTTRPISSTPRVAGETDGAEWSPWVSLGGNVASAPAASGRGVRSANMDVFAKDASGRLVHKWFLNGSWSNWENLGGAITSAPASISTTVNNVDVFARGADNGLAHLAWGASGWKAWEKIPGGILTSAPVVASLATGYMNVFAAGTDSHMYSTWSSGAPWAAWQDLGCCIVGAPGAVSTATSKLLTLARGTDNVLYAQTFNNGWSGWTYKLGATLSSPVTAISYAVGTARQTDVFGLAADGSLYQMSSDGASWSDWRPVSTFGGYQLAGVGYCLAADPLTPGGTVAQGSRIVLRTCDPNAMNQRFIHTAAGIQTYAGIPYLRRLYEVSQYLPGTIPLPVPPRDRVAPGVARLCVTMSLFDDRGETFEQKRTTYTYDIDECNPAAYVFHISQSFSVDQHTLWLKQQWIEFDQPRENFTWKNLCINASGNSWSDGTQVIGFPCSGAVNDNWYWR